MTPPKKMSLQEFFSDESYGGSWADEDFDIASISVPIERNKGSGYGGNSRYGSGPNNFGASRSNFLDNGPPYIVKLSNIPITSNDAFITDLFRSRFTPLTKFKILFDPFSQPLELGIVKKIAFVELSSFESQNKVAKWQDVVYKGSRRVTIEVADFNDFQQSMRFNQEHHQELLRAEQTFLASGSRGGHANEVIPGRNRPGLSKPPGGMPLDSIQLPGSKHLFGPSLGNRRRSKGEEHHTGTIVERPSLSDLPLLASSKPKPNPFGNAKPIDVLAHQKEIEKNLIVLKHTTHTAPWVEGVRQPPQSSQKSSNAKSAWGTHNKNLADILGKSKTKDHTKNSRSGSSTSTSKPVTKKPTILMKNPAALSSESEKKPKAIEKMREEILKNGDQDSSTETVKKSEEKTNNSTGVSQAVDGLKQDELHPIALLTLVANADESSALNVPANTILRSDHDVKTLHADDKNSSTRRRSDIGNKPANDVNNQSHTSSPISPDENHKPSSKLLARPSKQNSSSREEGQREKGRSQLSNTSGTTESKPARGSKNRRKSQTGAKEFTSGRTISRNKPELLKTPDASKPSMSTKKGNLCTKNSTEQDETPKTDQNGESHLRRGQSGAQGTSRGSRGRGEGRKRTKGRGKRDESIKEKTNGADQ